MNDTPTPDILGLIEGLSNPDPTHRAQAAEQLAHLAEGARPAAVALARAAGDEQEEVREWTVAAIEALGPPEAGDATALTAMLADSSPDVGYWAATLLGRLGAAAAGAVPALAAAVAGPAHLPVRHGHEALRTAGAMRPSTVAC